MAVDAGRAAPAPRKQQGSSRQFLGSFGKEVDAERLAQLRKDNLEFRQEREKDEERRRKRNQEMAEAWKIHQTEMVAKVKEERRIQLARLEGRNDRSMTLKDRSLTLSEKEAEIVDEEYRMLLEKYGNRVRVPRVPPSPWKTRSVSSVDSPRSRSNYDVQRKLRAKPKQRPAPTSANEVGAVTAGGGSSSAAAPSRSSAPEKKHPLRDAMGQEIKTKAPTPGRASIIIQQPGGAVALPALATAAAPRPNAAGTGAGADALVGDSVMSEVPEPERSLMPRKDTLRKFQQQLLKKTDVSFYKNHMKRHFRRIVEATEVTFSDYNTRRQQANWNLAKPLSVAEIKQLSSVVVRNP